MAGATGALAALAGVVLWIFLPVERIAVAIAPVVNQTGYTELDAGRMALTHELSAQLSESRLLRVLPYDHLLQSIRRFRQPGRDVSSREALQAFTAQSGATIIAVPTLLYENGSWRARVELRDVGRGTSAVAYAVEGVGSDPMPDAAYRLMPALAARIDKHFTESAPWRVALATGLRRMTTRAPAAARPRLLSLDAAVEFERGLDAYQQQEYAHALERFTASTGRDDRNPLPWAWRARAARLVREESEASNAAERAAGLLAGHVRRADRLLVEAIVSEVRRDTAAAQARYRELAAVFSDEPEWLLELAAFQDRSASNAEGTASAITTYLQALDLDDRLIRAEIELCRLYGPARQNDMVEARSRGQRALDASRAIGDRVSEAQALMCLTEVLKVGSDQQRRQAERSAQMARDILADTGSIYNLSHAELNIALGAAARGNMQEAATVFNQALESARKGRNRVLQPLLLMNLAAANVSLGDRPLAMRHYQASSELYNALGDEQRAAQQQANSTALRIEYGDEPQAALRDIESALGVFQKHGDSRGEAFCLRLIAAYYRQSGRHADAERELNRALDVLRERDLDDDIDAVTVDRASSLVETANYVSAAVLLDDLVANKRSRSGRAAHIHLARIRHRLGDTAGAEAELSLARGAAEDRSLAPLFFLVTGQVAFDRDLFPAARAAFLRAATSWTGALPDAASVEARAWIGFLDILDGRATGRTLIQTSLEQAGRMDRPGLAARCRLFLAQADLRQKRNADALHTINQIPPDDDARTIGPELLAQRLYLRSVALAGTGNRDQAQADLAAARKVLSGVSGALPEADRATFTSRADISRIIG